jgi:hypothetical protein
MLPRAAAPQPIPSAEAFEAADRMTGAGVQAIADLLLVSERGGLACCTLPQTVNPATSVTQLVVLQA